MWITRFYNCYCFCVVVFCMCHKNSLFSTLQKGKQTKSSGNQGDGAGCHDRHYSWHIKNFISFLCVEIVEAKERILRSDLQKSSIVSRMVLVVSDFSPDVRHRTGESTMTVIWNSVSMSRRAGIVASVNFLGSQWRQTNQIWCFRGLRNGKGWREREVALWLQNLLADLCICKCWFQRQGLGQSCGGLILHIPIQLHWLSPEVRILLKG